MRRKLLDKEEEIKEIREHLQTLAKDFGIQGNSPVEIISQISRSYTKQLIISNWEVWLKLPFKYFFIILNGAENSYGAKQYTTKTKRCAKD